MRLRARWIAGGAGLVVLLSSPTPSSPAQTRPWYKIDEARRTVETPQMIWQWTDPGMADYPIPKVSGNYGISGVTQMLIKSTNHNQLYNPRGMDAQTGVAKIGLSESFAADNDWVGWVDTFKTLETTDEYVEIDVHRSTSNKPPHPDWNILHVRYYREYPVMQIRTVKYQGGTFNFSFRPGECRNSGDATVFIHGAPPITRQEWTKAKQAAKSEMMSALLPRFGTTLEACVYKGHYILGFYNVRNNEGVGFVVSLEDYTVTNRFHPEGYKDIKCWMIDVVGTGWFPRPGSTQWFYAVTRGPAEIDALGKMIVDHRGVPPRRSGSGRGAERN